MKRSTKTALAAGGGLTALLALLLWPRKSKADDADFDEADDDNGGAVYVESQTNCFRDGQPYNAAQLGSPEQVVSALRKLGTPIGLVELMMSDSIATTPIWTASADYKPSRKIRGRSDKLKSFQATARSLNLEGHEGASVAAIDGVWGECTARSVTDALRLQERGDWPYQPIAGLSP